MVSVGTSAKDDLGANVKCPGPREIRAVPSIFLPPAQPREACINSMAYVLCQVSGAVTGPSFSQPWSVRQPRAGFDRRHPAGVAVDDGRVHPREQFGDVFFFFFFFAAGTRSVTCLAPMPADTPVTRMRVPANQSPIEHRLSSEVLPNISSFLFPSAAYHVSDRIQVRATALMPRPSAFVPDRQSALGRWVAIAAVPWFWRWRPEDPGRQTLPASRNDPLPLAGTSQPEGL